ncbi:MAG: hypothetical protein CMH54_01495 [Myxococcales bacterium]|nr:hypothetical protein [Myxococcales bacterium]
MKQSLPFYRIVLATFCVALFALSGCSAEKEGCQDDYDCPNLEICVQGSCQPYVCKEHSDCVDPAMECIANRCEGGSTSDVQGTD